MLKNVDISRNIYKIVPQLLFEYFQKDKDMKVTLSKNKKELVSKLWSVSETNSKYTSNNKLWYKRGMPFIIIDV